MAGSGLLYWRILRLRRVQPRPAITFLLFEGSITLGALLAFAGVLTWWGAAAVPIAVAVMVKLNDVVATNLDLRPLAEAQLRVPRPTDGRRMGISPVPAAAGEPAASPDAEPVVVRGVASVPPRSRPPVPTLGPQDRTESSLGGAQSSPDNPVLTAGSGVSWNVASDGVPDGVPDVVSEVVSDGEVASEGAPQSSAEPAVPEPAATEPAVPEPAVPEPAVPEPADTEPATPDGDAGRRPPSNPGHFGA